MSDMPQELVEALNDTKGIVVKHVMGLEQQLAVTVRRLETEIKISNSYLEDIAELREAGTKIISAIRSGLSQDELEAMEEFELLQESSDGRTK